MPRLFPSCSKVDETLQTTMSEYRSALSDLVRKLEPVTYNPDRDALLNSSVGRKFTAAELEMFDTLLQASDAKALGGLIKKRQRMWE